MLNQVIRHQYLLRGRVDIKREEKDVNKKKGNAGNGRGAGRVRLVLAQRNTFSNKGQNVTNPSNLQRANSADFINRKGIEAVATESKGDPAGCDEKLL